MKIVVQTTVKAPPERVWQGWTMPSDIKQWNAASEDWHTTKASIDLRVGGAFSYRMEAKDGSMGFEFKGTFTQVIPEQSLKFVFEDGRQVEVAFSAIDQGTHVRETFDADTSHDIEQQRDGWQAILDNFKRHIEGDDPLGSSSR